MTIIPDLESFIGKNINLICGNGFHNARANHCAHFVSHATGLTFSYNCREFARGQKTPANIRVHEIFAECPRVGRWQDANQGASQLIFVTRKDVVNLATRTMQNIPQKHIGVYHNGLVYHYSNTQDRVVKQTAPDFYERFQQIYAGDQGLFYGEFPNSDLELTVDATAATVPHPYAFAFRKDGGRWLARRTDTAESAEFFVGDEVVQPAKKFYGLRHPIRSYYGPTYDAQQYSAVIDHWAYLIDLTALCESETHLNLINTYDRAHFTFGFYQLAAHTPRDNLILFFRTALLDAEFRALFPDLDLRGGKVFRVAQDGTATDLEEEFYDPPTKEYQLKRFMTYLNPQRMTVDQQEVLQATRMVWWANESKPCADAQVRVANEILQRKMSERYAKWYDLNGERDIVCAIIADIHHHGRAKRSEVKRALASSNKIAALLNIGRDKYPNRITALSSRIKKWKDAGILGSKRYNAGLNEFE